jgi:hypothetical protein
MPISGDWNDLLCNSRNPEAAKKKFNNTLYRYRIQARLTLANTAFVYAKIYSEINSKTSYVPGLFTFDECYYWSWINTKNDKGAIGVKRVSNFTINVEHYQRSDIDTELPIFKYRLKVIPKKGNSVLATASGDNLKSSDNLNGFFLRHAKTQWLGNSEASKAFSEMIVSSKAPIVRQAEYVGYDQKSNYHILKDIAVTPKGKIVNKDINGFFKLSHGEYLRPALVETVNPGKCDVRKIYTLLTAAWGENAIVALGFLAASLFVNQVKSRTKFFPFLSLYGEPQTGKSRLLTILNAMQCFDEEGIPMNSANTKKGELRTLAQVSGHMKGLLEANNSKNVRFDFDTLLSTYNYGNPLQLTAQTSNDNRTRKLPFYGTIAFAQNSEPFRSRAQKERVISLEFSTDNLNNDY